MRKSIDLYLISGFLGSGKTTFLKQLLEQSSSLRVGVIVNEFGSIGIDGKILKKKDLNLIEINNGSIFCACLKGDFVKTLVAFLEQPIDVLFIEASGMADPSNMKNLLEQLNVLLEKKPKISQYYKYKGSICLIDAGRFIDFCDMFQPTKNQVKKSSLLILNKIDEVSEENIAVLQSKLLELNQKAHVYYTSFGKVPLELLESKVRPDGVLEDETTNTVWNRPTVYIIEMKETYDLDKMKMFSLGLSEKALRLKGFFRTTEDEVAHADCVGDYISIEAIGDKEIEVGCSYKIVLIGKNNKKFEEEVRDMWNKYFPEKALYCERNK